MRLNTSQLGINNNRYTILSRVVNNTFCCNLNNEERLRKVMVKIDLERVNTQEGVTVEVFLDSGAVRLVMSSEFKRK